MSAKIQFLFLLVVIFCALSRLVSADPVTQPGKDYQQYTDFFEKVYKVFEDNYYLAPDRKIYDNFIKKFNTNIYAQLKSEGKSIDYVRWRSAWYLVDELRSKDDKFTQFVPPGKPATQFHHDVLAQKVDLGIEGKKNDIGFLVTRIEPHSDAFDKGLREDDIILKIDGASLKNLTEDTINSKLTPVVNTKIHLSYLDGETKIMNAIDVVSKEYFKQTVFLHQVPVNDVFCLEITHFNEMTAPEMAYYIRVVKSQNAKGLVLDLRGNPGGQVGGAQIISSFFLNGNQELAYFQKRNSPKYGLDMPETSQQNQFTGPIVILVDAGTGSAAELFSGIMQSRHRAVVLGVNTAGQILLKNTFSLDDGSEIGLVTSRGYYPDGTVFGFDGITPDKIISDAPKEGLINLAAALIAMKAKQ